MHGLGQLDDMSLPVVMESEVTESKQRQPEALDISIETPLLTLTAYRIPAG